MVNLSLEHMSGSAIFFSKTAHATQDTFFLEVFGVNQKLLHRSEPAPRKSIQWRDFALNLSDLGSVDDIFTVNLYAFSEVGAHALIGTLSTTLRTWLFLPYRESLSGSLGREVGALCVNQLTFLQQSVSIPTFAAYRVSPWGVKLAACDVNGLSDPFFIVYTEENGKKLPVYRSEVMAKTLNPSWNSFVLPATCGLNTTFFVDVYDWDTDGGHDLIGTSHFTIHDLVFGEYRTALSGGVINRGGFCLRIEETLAVAPVREYSPSYSVKFGIAQLTPRKGKGVILQLFKQEKMLYCTETMNAAKMKQVRTGPSPNDNSLSGTWTPFQIDLEDFGSPDASLKFKVLHFSRRGNHKEVGECELMLLDLLCGGFSYPLRNRTLQLRDSNAAFILEEISPLKSTKHLFERHNQPTNEPPPSFSFKCCSSKLSSKDLNGKSDPFFKILSSSQLTLYRSEVIPKNLNPDWKGFQLNLAELNGMDGNGSHEEIGSVKLKISDFIYNGFTFPLSGPRLSLNSGGFTLAKPIPTENTIISIQESPAFKVTVSGRKLAAKDINGKSDPFFILYVDSEARKKPIPLYRSEVILKCLNPVWQPFIVRTHDLPFDKKFKVMVYDSDNDGSHDLIGSLTTTLREWSFGNVQDALYTDTSLTTCGCFSVDQFTPFLAPLQGLPTALRVTATGVSLKRTRLTSTGAPYFEILSKNHSFLLYRSVPSTDNSPWKPFEISPEDVDGWDSEFSVKCFNHFKDGSNDLIGSMEVTLREWLFSSFNFALKPEGVSVTSSAGAFRIISSEPIDRVSQIPLYDSFNIQPKGIKLDCNSDLWFELFLCMSEQPLILLHRSELATGSSPDWKPFSISLRNYTELFNTCLLKLCVYSFKGGLRIQVGKVHCNYRDLLFGIWFGELSNKKKIHTPMYRNSGCMQLDVQPFVNVSPTVFNASAYRLSCRFTAPSHPDSVTGGILKLKGTSCTGLPSVLLETPFFADVQMEFTIPFEGVQTLDTDIEISLPHCHHAHTTLRNLGFMGVCTSIKVKQQINKSRPSHLSLVVDSCQAIYLPITDYQVQFSVTELPRSDDLVGLSDPFLQVINPDTEAVIINTEVHTQELSPTFAPVNLNIGACGGMDTPIKVAVYDYDPHGPADFLGGCKITLRRIIQELPQAHPIYFVDEEKQARLTTYKHSGILTCKLISPLVNPTTTTTSSAHSSPHFLSLPQHLNPNRT
ncbi:hypothetical protein Pelo_8290 [Pelomyxa schiedti]|nr:hypothetical protein Pelo_8290 [Pelomyxa schiedti]